MRSDYQALTEKERATLRLLLDGHDAKSIARHLGLSVHTIHERLRDARRKMGTSSSREAARLLREIEGRSPEWLGDKAIGDAPPASLAQPVRQPDRQHGDWRRTGWLLGALAMTVSLALLALSAIVGSADVPPEAQSAASKAQSSAAESSAAESPAAQSPAVHAALQWLALVDAKDWKGAFAESGQSFRRSNTVEGWTAAATGVRAQYGITSGRSLISSEWVPSPPNGYRIIKFRAMTSKQGLITETLSLADEGGVWRVVGIVID